MKEEQDCDYYMRTFLKVRENRRDNQEKLATQGTQDEDKQNKKKTTQKCVGDHYAQGNTINVNKT